MSTAEPTFSKNQKKHITFTRTVPNIRAGTTKTYQRKPRKKGVNISSYFCLDRCLLIKGKTKITCISAKKTTFSVLLLLWTVGLRWSFIRYWVSTQNCQRITIKSQHFYIHLHISYTRCESRRKEKIRSIFHTRARWYHIPSRSTGRERGGK